MEGRRPLVSTPVKNWSLTITSQYAFLACLSSFMVRYSGVLGVEEQHQSIPNLVVKLYCGDDTVGEGTPGNTSSGDGVGLVAQRIRARGYEPRCRGILYQTCVAVYKIRNGLFSDFLDIYSASSLSPEGSPSPVAADSPNRR
ncbi:unnamed protein product [Microthlaspi erraticum]|uniref:Uncharacterized protein n=1 Tax=Microthlaspi erraticum TaxID=1685480 RepID=A0A6D2HB29_9BRAS|nr:unnamed protein product [Microthlaspi erraticum]